MPLPGYYDMEFNCTVKGIMESTYGKMATDDSDRQVVMELAPWFTLLSEHLPPRIEHMPDGVPPEFMDWLREPTTAFSFSSILVMTLPSPRYLYYEEQSFDVIQNNVLQVTNEISDKLGFYPLNTSLALLG